MVIENLQITPLGEWLLGAGWHNGWLWSNSGVVLLLALLLGGGCALVMLLRRRSGRPGAVASAVTGCVLGALSLVVLAALVMCTTVKTRYIMDVYVATPIFNQLTPVLGAETAKDSDKAKGQENEQSQQKPPEKNWTSGALYTWIGAVGGLSGLIYFFCWLGCVLVSGPAQGTEACGRATLEVATDIARISPRRVFALSWLAVRESIRRRVAVVFFMFVLIILFAGLFMKNDSLHPSQLYITVVLNSTVYLTMLFALILSSLSLPGDIRDHTLHTVVTKPVRKIEIVLGRVLGFTFVGTVLLAAIGLISYGFTVRGLDHRHKLTSDMLQTKPLPGNGGLLKTGETSESHGHTHRVTIIEKSDGKGNYTDECTVETKQDHTHSVYIKHKDNGDVEYELGPPEGQLQAREPIYGKLTFTDKTGKLKNQEKNINVGDEWTYRSFIEGRTNARAEWTFSDLREDMFPEDQFPNGIPVEMTIEVFRTHKGNMEKGVPGTIWLVNPTTEKRVRLEDFAAEKFATDTHMIPLHFSREGRDGRIEHIDLFRDLVSEGKLGIELQCLEYGQCFGMAQPDMYIHAADGSFEWNFVKGYFGIWLQMVLVLSVGVMFSTFVSGSVALMATLFFIIMGLFSGYLVDLASGKMIGGGPFEAALRTMTQDNMISELQPGIQTTTIKALDQATAVVMRFVSAVVPDINDSSFGRYLAYGFNIGRDLLSRCILREIGYVLPVLLIAFLCLRQREVAQ